MVKLSDIIKIHEVTLPVSGAVLSVKDSLSWGDEVAMRQAGSDPDVQGAEALKRIVQSWNIVDQDGNEAPKTDETLRQLPTSDVKYLLKFVMETVTRPRTPEEVQEQQESVEALEELAAAHTAQVNVGETPGMPVEDQDEDHIGITFDPNDPTIDPLLAAGQELDPDHQPNTQHNVEAIG